MPPASSHGVAYIGLLTSVAAVRTTDGSSLWQTIVGGDAFFATLAHGVLYVGSGAHLDALRESSGKLLWGVSANGFVTPLIIASVCASPPRMPSKDFSADVI